MEPINFVYWLQGYLEIQDPRAIDAEKVKIIKEHIALVLKKETPIDTVYKNIDSIFPLSVNGIPYSC